MPPKVRVTREMILDAAFAVAREAGAAAVNARTVAARLRCSTQPVLYHFGTMEALRRAVCEKADSYHTEYLMNVAGAPQEAMLGIGLNYIRFAMEEPQLFRLLFQSGCAPESSLLDLLDAEALAPVLSAMQQAAQLPMARVKEAFASLALFTHGYASLLAGGALAYDEKTAIAQLERAYRGALLAAQEEEHESDL